MIPEAQAAVERVEQTRRRFSRVATLLAVIAVAVLLAVTVTGTVFAVKAFHRLDSVTSPRAVREQAKVGGQLVECGTLRAITVYIHEAMPHTAVTFPAFDGCPMIVIPGDSP